MSSSTGSALSGGAVSVSMSVGSGSSTAVASNHAPTTPTGAAVESHVQVAVRCRPLNEREKAAGRPPVLQCKTSANEIAVAKRKTYAFDKVYGQYSTQKDVFKATVRPVVDEALAGYNCTVFAYGQTGTGKTYTMQGALAPDDDMAGIIPRCVRYIFDALQSSSQEYSVKVSFLQLYNEELKDLLAPESKKLRLMEDPKRGGIYCQNLLEVTTTTAGQVFELLETGVKNRITSETLMNENSSRSHSIFTIRIHSKESNPGGEDLIKTGQLNLVDLAGSECVGRSGARNVRAREAGNINQSLLTLGRVITALVDNHPHIPYRDSKLTRLLQESLGGRTKTTIIATLAPCADSIDETLSTLEYAHRAKNIKNKPEVNQKTTKAGLLREYGHEIETLRSALQAARSKDGIYLPPAQFAEMQERISGQAVQLSELEDELEARTKTCKELEDEVQTQRDAYKDLEHAKLAVEQALVAAQHELATTQTTLAATQAALATTSAERDAFAANEKVLLANGARATALFHESEERAALLLAKIERKARVDASNSSLATSFADASTAQITAFQARLQQHEREHATFVSDITQSIAQLQAAHATDVSDLVATLASLEALTSARHSAQAREVGEETQATQERTEKLTTSLREHDAALQQELERLVALSARHATTLAQELCAAKAQSVAFLDDVAAKLASSRTEMAAFLTAHAAQLQALQATIDASMAEQRAQLDVAKQSLVAALTDAHAKQQREMEAMKQQLTQYVDACVASQAAQLDAQTHVIATHTTAQTQQLERVRSAAEREILASATAVAAQREAHETRTSALHDSVERLQRHVQGVAEQHDELVRATTDEQKRAVEAAGRAAATASAAIRDDVAAQQRASAAAIERRQAASDAFASEHSALERSLASGHKTLETHLTANVVGTKRTFEAMAALSETVMGDATSETTQQRDALVTFLKKRKIDEATGTTPTKQSVAFPRFEATTVVADSAARTEASDADKLAPPVLRRTLSAASQTSTASSSSVQSHGSERADAASASQPELASAPSDATTASATSKSAPPTPSGGSNRFGARSGHESGKFKTSSGPSGVERKLKFGKSSISSASASSSIQAPRKFR